MNEHDSERMTHLLRISGFEAVPSLREADVVIVNTCCVREKAEQKFYSLMGRLKGLKRRRGILIGVAGCIAQMEKASIKERLPYIDFALGTSMIWKIRDIIEEVVENGGTCLEFSEDGLANYALLEPQARNGRIKAYVTIMKGCDNFCSYCIVPYVRGREESRDSKAIIMEIRSLAKDGVKEVTLLGQNVNSYNKGRRDLSFPELIEEIDRIEGIERIRFVTSHPKDLSDELIDCFGRVKSLCEHIHLPFQAGSNKILGLMNRQYTIEGYLEKIGRLRNRCKDIAITADCIVGFPGETEEDFKETYALVKQVEFDGLFSFCYSPRKMTVASTLPDRVPYELARERLVRLQGLQKEITRKKNIAMEGKVVEVLVEGMSKNSPHELTGRTRQNKIVNFKGTHKLAGEIVDVRVLKGYANSLKGEDLGKKA